MISGVSRIIVPVDDQERAKEFWTTRVGFQVGIDAPYGDERWLEVVPPDGSPALVLTLRPADQPRREVRDDLPHSDVFFTCDDIQRTYEELTERGVTFTRKPSKQPFGWWALFEDQDGTRYALQQS